MSTIHTSLPSQFLELLLVLTHGASLLIERREVIAAIKALTPVCLENFSRAPDAGPSSLR